MARERFELYGDESCGAHAITYGIVAIPHYHRADVERRLQRVKVKFRGGPDDQIHCNQLFNDDDRKVGPWKHLARDEVFDLVGSVAQQMRLAQSQQVLVTYSRTEPPPRIDGAWTNAQGAPLEAESLEYMRGDKAISVLLAGGAVQHFVTAHGIRRTLFIPDPDGDSKIPWSNAKKRKKDDILAAFWYFTEAAPSTVEIQPIWRKKPPILQVADCLAYVAQRAFYPPGENTTRFKALLAAFNAMAYSFRGAADGDT